VPARSLPRATLATTLLTLVLALSCADALAAQPPCLPEHNGRLADVEVTDPENQGSSVLYATHRLGFRFELGEGSEDAEGASYNPDPESVRLAPGPGVLGPTSFAGRSGAQSVTVEWTVRREGPFIAPAPFCAASQQVQLQLRRPKPTRFQVLRNTVDRTGAEPRLLVNIAGERNEDLRSLESSIRVAGGKRRELFALPLADVSGGHEKGLRRYRHSAEVAGMTISSAPTNASNETRGLLSVALEMPRLRDGQRLRRSFSLEFDRDGKVLLRVRATIACHAFGALQPVQYCSLPLFRVSHPG